MFALETLPQRAVGYDKTHDFPGAQINDRHRALLEAPLKAGGVKIRHRVKGSLRREDAGKIYELAYFAEGDTADIGTNYGLSAVIAARAITDAGRADRVTTVDLDPRAARRARRAFLFNWIRNADAVTQDAAEWLDGQIAAGNTFGFVFVDHSHAYGPVRVFCERLDEVVKPGAHVAFHDFVDQRSGSPEHPDYDVPRAVRDGLSDRFGFVGCAGCVGIFRFKG